MTCCDMRITFHGTPIFPSIRDIKRTVCGHCQAFATTSFRLVHIFKHSPYVRYGHIFKQSPTFGMSKFSSIRQCSVCPHPQAFATTKVRPTSSSIYCFKHFLAPPVYLFFLYQIIHIKHLRNVFLHNI